MHDIEGLTIVFLSEIDVPKACAFHSLYTPLKSYKEKIQAWLLSHNALLDSCKWLDYEFSRLLNKYNLERQ
jgi:hypothetical protein